MAERHLLMVGFPKCASTTLFSLLAQHPDVAASVRKETWILYPSMWEGRVPTEAELGAYRAALPDDGRVGLEASICHVFAQRATVSAVAARIPDAHPVAVLREPGERLWSAYRFMHARGLLPDGTYADFVADNLAALREGRARFEPGASYDFHVSSGLYARHLAAWAEVFDGRLALVGTDALARGPASVAGRLFGWLNLPPADVEPGSWNVTRTSRRRGLLRRPRPSQARPALPDDLRDELDRVHREDQQALRRLIREHVEGPVLGIDWLDVEAAA